MNNRIIEQAAAEHVEELFRIHPADALLYHSFNHTERVVARAAEIADAMGASPRDKQVLAMAAWFHDTGHLTGDLKGHEERSIHFLRDFLRGQPVPDDPQFVADVERCILATKFPHSPADGMEEIICDADCYHFGTREFRDTNKQVREELRLRGHEDLTRAWAERSLRILEQQRFFTSYCRERLGPGKEANLDRWRRRVAEKTAKAEQEEEGETAQLPAARTVEDDAQPAEESREGKPKDKKKDKAKSGLSPQEEARQKEARAAQKKQDGLVARGVQTALRLASENHMELSGMADGKANILISVNSIIIGVILSVLLRRLEVNPELTVPTLIFLASSVATIVIAILATLPKLTQGRFSREDIVNKRTNLLFFGNFHHSSLEDYQWAMNRLLQDAEYIYGSVVKDIYFLGVVLGRKYRLIRLAYYVFMVGIIVSVAAFLVAVLTDKPDTATTITTPNTPPL